jgi:hypothetical protein
MSMWDITVNIRAVPVSWLAHLIQPDSSRVQYAVMTIDSAIARNLE